jgi:uncharacterized protein (DUF2225 family)
VIAEDENIHPSKKLQTNQKRKGISSPREAKRFPPIQVLFLGTLSPASWRAKKKRRRRRRRKKRNETMLSTLFALKRKTGVEPQIFQRRAKMLNGFSELGRVIGCFFGHTEPEGLLAL